MHCRAARVLSLILWLAPLAAAAGVFLEVEQPAAERTAGTIGWTEVRGYAWTGESPLLDVVIVLDLSRSTLLASGSDVNRNGRVGRISPDAYAIFSGILTAPYSPRALSTDLGDTVARAELAAARRFVEASNPSRTRVAIVTFGDIPKLRVPLDAGRDAVLAEIARLERRERTRAREFGGRSNDFARALAFAGAELIYHRPRSARREVIALTDGLPDRPVAVGARQAAAVAWELSDRGVGVHMVPLGIVALRNAPYFEYVAKLTGDSHTAIARSGEVVEKLPEVRLDRLAALEIVNRSTGEAARDLRIFADGSFDALLRLRGGVNEVSFTARAASGETATRTRVLSLDEGPPRSLADAVAAREALERFAERVRVRARESELVAEMELARSRAAEAERTLRIERAADAQPANP
ncbi:MAG TPA: VWA domain-containing protein [Myxococcota bacterium]|nr:VWA domain-containing protein [Myxococcota bacterium]